MDYGLKGTAILPPYIQPIFVLLDISWLAPLFCQITDKWVSLGGPLGQIHKQFKGSDNGLVGDLLGLLIKMVPTDFVIDGLPPSLIELANVSLCESSQKNIPAPQFW